MLENIIYARALTHETQIDLLPTVAAKMAEDQFRLLIVDSLTSVFRTDFSGRGELAERSDQTYIHTSISIYIYIYRHIFIKKIVY